MAKIKEWALEEARKKEALLNEDLAWEHEQHDFLMEKCSTCMSPETRACIECGKINKENTRGNYCSEDCMKKHDADWAYDRSIGN